MSSVLKELVIPCDKCKHLNKQAVSEVPEFQGNILRSFWCENPECQKAQVVRYCFKDGVPEVVTRIEPSEVFVEKEPEVAITIRPRARSR